MLFSRGGSGSGGGGSGVNSARDIVLKSRGRKKYVHVGVTGRKKYTYVWANEGRVDIYVGIYIHLRNIIFRI